MREWLEADNSFDSANTRARGGFYAANGNSYFTATHGNNGVPIKRKSDNIYTGFRVVSLYPIAPKPEGPTNQRPSWIATQWSLGDAVAGKAFATSLTQDIFDPDHDANDLSFSLLSGPEWLSIDSQSHLVGSPSSSDLGTHEVMLRVTDPDGAYSDTEFPVKIKVIAEQVNAAAPNIKGPSGSAGDSTSSITISENGTTVSTFTANQTVTWSLNGGADASLFSIDSSSGALSFSSAPDYETPGDSDSGNDYVVTVRATDSADNTSDQTVTINVADIDEIAPLAPSLIISTRNDEVVIISGTAEIGSTVKLYNGSSLIDTVSPDSEGGFLSSLFEGVYSITATATDVAGNVISLFRELSLTFLNNDGEAEFSIRGNKRISHILSSFVKTRRILMVWDHFLINGSLLQMEEIHGTIRVQSLFTTLNMVILVNILELLSHMMMIKVLAINNFRIDPDKEASQEINY